VAGAVRYFQLIQERHLLLGDGVVEQEGNRATMLVTTSVGQVMQEEVAVEPVRSRDRLPYQSELVPGILPATAIEDQAVDPAVEMLLKMRQQGGLPPDHERKIRAQIGKNQVGEDAFTSAADQKGHLFRTAEFPSRPIEVAQALDPGLDSRGFQGVSRSDQERTTGVILCDVLELGVQFGQRIGSVAEDGEVDESRSRPGSIRGKILVESWRNRLDRGFQTEKSGAENGGKITHGCRYNLRQTLPSRPRSASASSGPQLPAS
jgi:hypothetical protein